MTINWQRAPANIRTFHHRFLAAPARTSRDGEHAVRMFVGDQWTRKVIRSAGEAQRVRFIVRSTILLADHDSAVITLMHVHAGCGDDAIQYAWHRLCNGNDARRRSLRNFDAGNRLMSRLPRRWPDTSGRLASVPVEVSTESSFPF